MERTGTEARIRRICWPKARVRTDLVNSAMTFLIFTLMLNLISACRRHEVAGTPAPAKTVTAAATATSLPPADMTYTPILENRPCETYNPGIGESERESYSCGVMVVPQDRHQPDGARIEIKYAILSSTGESHRFDPIVLLGGGPGNSALYPDAFAEMADRFGPMRVDRDIILFDQRGVGASSPQLDCAVVPPPDESHRADLLARYLTETGLDTIPEDNYQVDCVLGLWDQGVELSNFTSSASPADTVDLLHTLHKEYGYANFNLYAISYGTWLAETIARDFPEESLIRTLIIDSVFPLPNETELDGDRLVQSIYPFVDQDANWVNVIP